jgi:mucin-associated surface protein (MASP), putative
MTDLTWYSKERADRTFATKEDLARIGQGAAPTPGPDLSLYATKEEVSRGDGALSARLSSVEATTAGAMQTAAADAKYATKTDLQDSVQSLGQRMDSITSASAGYASKDELSQYATSAGVAEAYATKESLGDYLKSADAANTYATKAALAAAQIAGGGQAAPDLSGLATKTEVSQAESTLSARIDQVKATADAAAPMSALAGYVKTSDAQAAYATKESLNGYLTEAAATETYSAKKDLEAYKAQATSAFAPASLAQEVASVKETAESALPKDVASTTYATKEELTNAQLAGDGKIPDLSGYVKSAQLADYATKAELSGYAKTSSLAPISAKADAALPRSEASDTYATKEALTSATAPVAGLSSKVESLETSLRGKADASSLADLLPKAEASTTYATKEEVTSVRAAIPEAQDLSGYLTAESATATYATKADVEGVRSAIPAAPDLSPYLTADAASKSYATKADLAQAQAGGKVDLSGYLTTADADGKYATKEELSGAEAKASEASAKAATAVQPDALSAYATTEALTKVKQAAEAAAEAVAPPFRSGERYSSPVTYYWPDYYDEAKGTSKWAKALKAAGTLGIVILNKDSGNWDEKNEDFGKQAARALAAGARRAVFYVKTQYGVASLPSNDPARNGVPNPDKYTKEYILGQIAKFTEQYGDVAQGVFLDETINGWGAQAGRVQWYKDLIAAIREQYGQNFYIVVNAGSNMSPEMCALDFDTAMMFEQDAGKFLNEDANAPVLPDHMRSYPSEKWWAVIHGVTKDNYRQVFEKLDTLPIGHAYITDGVLVEDPDRGGQWEPVGNPYANPPSEQLIRLTSSWIRGTLGLHLEVEDLKAQVEALKKGGAQAGANAGQAGKLLVLGPNDPVPAGTPDDTVIVRREA